MASVVAFTNASTCLGGAQVEAMLSALQKEVGTEFKAYRQDARRRARRVAARAEEWGESFGERENANCGWRIYSLGRHPEVPRFHQRDEGSRVQNGSPREIPFDSFPLVSRSGQALRYA